MFRFFYCLILRYFYCWMSFLQMFFFKLETDDLKDKVCLHKLHLAMRLLSSVIENKSQTFLLGNSCLLYLCVTVTKYIHKKYDT